MGLKNAPASFQKVTTDALQSSRQFCSVYIDDIVIFSKSQKEASITYRINIFSIHRNVRYYGSHNQLSYSVALNGTSGMSITEEI